MSISRPARHRYSYDEYLAWVRVLATGKATYPDKSMVCGPIEGHPADPTGATITNPR